MQMRYPDRKSVYGWAMYDWANSAYSTTVMAGFFPVFFKQFWASNLSVHESTFWLGVANAVAGLLVAVMAPVLGAIADQGSLKKRMLLAFTILGILMTAALFLVTQGAWLMAMMLYIFGAIGFSGSNVFYDALIVDVAEEKRLDRVSSLGYALGYIGGGLMFAVCVVMTMNPEWFGLADKSEAVQFSFLFVALWWGLFTLPLLLTVHERGEAEPVPWKRSISAGWRQLVGTFHHIRRLKTVFIFLAAYFLYIDGVGTIVRMAVDYGLSLGFRSDVLIRALLLTQFVAFPAALAWGRVAEVWSAKNSIMACIAVYVGICFWAIDMETSRDFYLLAAAVGLVMGGIQALSRSFYARLIPAGQAAEFFGFYNMLGKFSAVLGPLMMGAASILFGSARLSILVVILLFAAGALLLYRVNVESMDTLKKSVYPSGLGTGRHNPAGKPD
ncbi:MAG: MFS transporter [Mariprofundaceae bacterium]|nr:MFS transporter [Mariprofundaceae bacterium]